MRSEIKRRNPLGVYSEWRAGAVWRDEREKGEQQFS
jgi:hypothetical protein